jgi:hypothetical protein
MGRRVGWVLLAMGCGNGGGGQVDASTPDAAADVAVVDVGVDAPTVGDVTISTLVRCCGQPQGSPAAGIVAIAVQPDNSVVTGTSDTTGTVVLHGIHTGATVTVPYPENTNDNTSVISFVGVEPGDHLTTGEGYFFPPPPGTAGTMTISFPAVTGATDYVAYTPCGTTNVQAPATSFTVTLYDYCQIPSANIGVIAQATGTIIASAYLTNAAFTPNATDSVPTWTANGQNAYAVTMSGVAPEVTTVALAGLASYPYASAIEPFVQNVTIVNGTATAMVTLPLTAPRMGGIAGLTRDQYGTQTAFHGGGPAASATFAAPKLPWMGKATTTATTLAWTQTAGSYDGAVATMVWHVTVSNVDHQHVWMVVLPPGTTSVDWTSPPAELASYLPAPTDTVNGDPALLDFGDVADYRAFRALPQWQFVYPYVSVLQGDHGSADGARVAPP